MARIDALLAAIERLGATGMVLSSDSSVVLRFADGDRAAKQTTAHPDLVAMIEEIAPRATATALRGGRSSQIEYASAGHAYDLGVEVLDASSWRVIVMPRRSGKSGVTAVPAELATPAAPTPTAAPVPGQRAATPAPVAGQRAGTAPVARPTPSPGARPGSAPAIAVPGARPGSAPAIAVPSAAPAGATAVIAPAAATPRPAPAARTSAVPVGGSPDRRVWLDTTLAQLAEMKGSDLLLTSGSPVRMRYCGVLVDRGADILAPDDVEAILRSTLTADQMERFEAEGELDLGYVVDGVGRFRTNVYRHQHGLAAVFHYIPLKPPSLADLGLPASLAKVTNYHQGMVLVTGPAGCGKSSTLAALVDLVNEDRHDHILTIEDPIEYKHPSKNCVVNQREVRRDTSTFARALRAALREDPDVIVIGELRDFETISLAMSAAETGHLVLATLHTNNVIRTINRLISVFPPNQQSQARSMLSESLRAIVSQRLLPRTDWGGVALALETMFVTRAVSNLIRENRAFQIGSILQTGRSQGQLMLDHSLVDLVKSGAITADVAANNSERPELFRTAGAQGAAPAGGGHAPA
ncbi:MAG: PilT/PilU family type 4a pilus ATPase [Kofleriaceae bacterium]